MVQLENTSPLVYIVVITFNGKHHLESCLPSVFDTDYSNYHVVIVDNASTDGSAEFVAEYFPEAEVLRHKENYGFAKGNNRAMSLALQRGADYIVLLNDDTKILDRRWLAEAVIHAESNILIGMVGFELIGQVQLDNWAGYNSLQERVTVSAVTAIEGCALLIRATLLENIGLFDEIYFAYAEESDLEMRAMRAGYRMMQLNIPLFHLGSGTSRHFPVKRSYLVMRNVIRHSVKNRNFVRTLLRIIKVLDVSSNPFTLCYISSDVTHQKIRGNKNFLLNFLLFLGALLWNIIYLPQTLAIRWQEYKLIRSTREKLTIHNELIPSGREP